MNINNLPDKALSVTSAVPAKAADRAVAPNTTSNAAPESSNAGVSVQLSAVTQTMTNGVARSATDVFNSEKVQAVRAAIENGSFSVNAEAIADKMLSNAREMLGVASAN